MSNKIDGKSAAEWIEKARAYIDGKKYHRAIACLENAGKLAPEDRSVWFWMGRAYDLLGQLQKAGEFYLKANQISENALTYNNMGFILYRLKKYNESLVFLLKSVELDHQLKFPWNNMGLVYNRLRDYQKALMCLDEALKIDPNYALAYNNKGWTYQNMKDKRSAITFYEKAIEADTKCLIARKNLLQFKASKKTDPEDWNQEGLAYLELKKYKHAYKCFLKAKELNLAERIYWHNLGYAMQLLRKYRDAILNYEKANEINPTFLSYNNMGNCYVKLKQFDKALQCFEQASALDPESFWVLNNIGNSYYNQKNFAKASEYFQKALKLNPRYTLALYNLGKAHAKLRNRLEAVECWMQVLAIDPNYKAAENQLAEFLIKHPSVKREYQEKHGVKLSARIKFKF